MNEDMNKVGDKLMAFYKKKIFWIPMSIFFLIILIVAISSDTPADNKPSVKNLGRGEEGILNNNTNPSDCSGKATVAFTQEAFETLTKAATAKDDYGYAEVLVRGQATLVPNCTKIKVIDSTFATRQVRLIDSPEISGWVPYEWAKAAQ